MKKLSGLLLVAACATAQQKPIEDVEPEVTREVATAVAARADVPCKAQLELLRRSVNGEERNYVYRMPCTPPMTIAVTYGKNGKIKSLDVQR